MGPPVSRAHPPPRFDSYPAPSRIDFQYPSAESHLLQMECYSVAVGVHPGECRRGDYRGSSPARARSTAPSWKRSTIRNRPAQTASTTAQYEPINPTSLQTKVLSQHQSWLLSLHLLDSQCLSKKALQSGTF